MPAGIKTRKEGGREKVTLNKTCSQSEREREVMGTSSAMTTESSQSFLKKIKTQSQIIIPVMTYVGCQGLNFVVEQQEAVVFMT